MHRVGALVRREDRAIIENPHFYDLPKGLGARGFSEPSVRVAFGVEAKERERVIDPEVAVVVHENSEGILWLCARVARRERA